MFDPIRLKQISQFKAPVRLGIFIGALAILWLPLALPLYAILSYDRNLASILTMALLFVELLFLWQFWGRQVYGEKRIFARYGLVINRKNLRDLLKGWAMGFLLCSTLFASEIMFGWAVIVEPIGLRIAIEGLLSALGIAFAEEMLFRGWLLDELRRDYSKQTGMWVSAIAFATAHFLKPITEIVRTAVTFPALVLLGIALVLAKYRHRDRLGICVGIHGGLVWGYYIVNVSQAIEYTNRVPIWVTGIDNNPIAGVMGLLFLSGLVWLAAGSIRNLA